MSKLTTKQICYLRSLAQKIKPVFQVGKDGVNDNMRQDILNYLNKNELMKVSILQNAPCTLSEAAEEFEELDITIVQKIGRTVVLYKFSENAKNPIIFEK